MRRCSEVLERLAAEKRWLAKLLRLLPVLYSRDDVHGLGHVVRVTCLALRLAGERGDVDVILAAGLLHDVGRGAEESTGLHHAILSAVYAEDILSSIGFPEEKIGAVVDAVLAHSYSLGYRPYSLEAAALSDADKLDALGAIGVYRASAEGYRRGRGVAGTIKHYYEKLSRLADLLVLEESRKVAEERVKLLDSFFAELEEETGDERGVIEYIDELVRSAGAHITAARAQRRSTSSARPG